MRLVQAAAVAALLAAGTAGAAEPTRIAIANFGPHGSLEQVISGFKGELARRGYVEGENVVYEYSHGNFDPALIPQILTQLEAQDPDLMLTVTTPVTQAATTIVKDPDLPIVFAPVTDPVDAGIVPSWEQGSERMVGASNLQSMDVVLDFAEQLLGGIDSFGMLYNPGDANDVVNMEVATEAAERRGLEFQAVSVESVNDIQARAMALGDVDFIYAIPSSMLMPAFPAIAGAADRMGIPVISSSPQAVQEGMALAAMSVSWEQVGANAGALAAEILEGAEPSELAVARPRPEEHEPTISARRLEQAGLTLPEALEGCDCLVE